MNIRVEVPENMKESRVTLVQLLKLPKELGTSVIIHMKEFVYNFLILMDRYKYYFMAKYDLIFLFKDFLLQQQ